VLRCLQSGSIQTIYGRKTLIFKIVEDQELGSIDAKTEFSREAVTVTCKRSVELGARFGLDRHRMTLAHELGHATMHSGEAKFRLSGATGTTSLSEISAYTSAEHQAKVFASAFLIHDEDATTMTSAEEIAEQFGVSFQAASICLERLAKKAERARSVERVLKMSEEAKAALKNASTTKRPAYLDDICTVCHQQTLLPNGSNQVSCDTCRFKGARYQDGDKAA